MFKRRGGSVSSLSGGCAIFSLLALVIWALLILFPLYWLVITSFKTPIEVGDGPFYVPFVDFKAESLETTPEMAVEDILKKLKKLKL
jgi:ABC-type glycerol-3-phosphate transport system permease component